MTGQTAVSRQNQQERERRNDVHNEKPTSPVTLFHLDPAVITTEIRMLTDGYATMTRSMLLCFE